MQDPPQRGSFEESQGSRGKSAPGGPGGSVVPMVPATLIPTAVMVADEGFVGALRSMSAELCRRQLESLRAVMDEVDVLLVQRQEEAEAGVGTNAVEATGTATGTTGAGGEADGPECSGSFKKRSAKTAIPGFSQCLFL